MFFVLSSAHPLLFLLLREVLWDCYERAVSSSRARAKKIAQKELEIASKDDATGKAAAWVLTKQVRCQ